MNVDLQRMRRLAEIVDNFMLMNTRTADDLYPDFRERQRIGLEAKIDVCEASGYILAHGGKVGLDPHMMG